MLSFSLVYPSQLPGGTVVAALPLEYPLHVNFGPARWCAGNPSPYHYFRLRMLVEVMGLHFYPSFIPVTGGLFPWMPVNRRKLEGSPSIERLLGSVSQMGDVLAMAFDQDSPLLTQLLRIDPYHSRTRRLFCSERAWTREASGSGLPRTPRQDRGGDDLTEIHAQLSRVEVDGSVTKCCTTVTRER